MLLYQFQKPLFPSLTRSVGDNHHVTHSESCSHLKEAKSVKDKRGELGRETDIGPAMMVGTPKLNLIGPTHLNPNLRFELVVEL